MLSALSLSLSPLLFFSKISPKLLYESRIASGCSLAGRAKKVNPTLLNGMRVKEQSRGRTLVSGSGL